MYVIHVCNSCLSVCLSVCLCLSVAHHSPHTTRLIHFIVQYLSVLFLYQSLLLTSYKLNMWGYPVLLLFCFFALFGTRLSCFSSLGRQLFGPLPTRWWNEDSASLAEKLQEQLVKFADQSSLYIYILIYIIDFYKT